MKLERVYADKAESLRRWCWTLELISVLGAIAAFSAGPKQKFWIAAGLALLLLSFLLRWSVAGHLGRLTPLDVPWALLLVGALVGLWASYDVSLSLPVLLMLVASVSLYHVVVNAPQPRALAQVAVVAGLTAGAYFLAQYQYTGFQDKSVLASWLGRTISGWFPRLGWWSPSPNGVASLLEGLVPLALGLAITGRSWVWRIVGGVPAAVMALALVVTASRGAWVALAVGMVLWLASRWRAGLVTLAVGVPIVAVALAGYLALTKGTDLQHVPGIGPVLHELFARPDRLEVYRGSLRLIQDFPLTGIGLGEVFALVYSKYVLLIQVPFLTYSHNLYLTVWLGHGLLGVVGIGWLLVTLVLLVIREEKKGHSSALFQAAWIGVAIVLVHGLFDARQYVDLWAMWPLFVLPALVVSSQSRTLAEGSARLQRLAGLRKMALGFLFLLVVGGVLMWRPVAAMAYANLGAVRQTKAELADLPADAREIDLQSAAASYGRALELDPHNRTASLRLGNLAVDRRRYEEGVAYLETAWQASPRDPTARKALGLACVWTGDTERAVRLLGDTKGIAAELDAWAQWHRSEGRDQLAVNARQTMLALRPPHYRCGINCSR